LVFGFKLVQNSCICTSFNVNDVGEINFMIKTADFFEIFLALTPTTSLGSLSRALLT